jgi:geranylgeranyl diphosphate synthase type II
MKKVPARRRLQAIHRIARAAGSLGMVGGQTMDFIAQRQRIEPHLLEYIHTHKTGALIAASAVAGAIVSGGSAKECRNLNGYGEKIGLAFQVIDDLLDLKGEVRKLGKAVRKDQARGKATYPALFGLADSRRKAEGLISEALNFLQPFDRRANPLREIAQFILERAH